MTDGRRAHIIVLGNEKGGSGKSTSAMHLVVALLEQGRRVATIDLDGRQRTLTRYLENRARAVAEGANLLVPSFAVITRSEIPDFQEAQADERARFLSVLEDYVNNHDVVIIDCPGSDSFLSRLAHGCADTLLTPMNDSFIDLDLIARVDPADHTILGPSLYSELVWEMRKRRARTGGTVDWLVMRNRVGHLDARNKRRVSEVLARLAKRIGFRVVAGLSERVTYRELFLQGLTMLDLGRTGSTLTMSEVAARQEVRTLVASLELPPVDRAAAPLTSAAE
ncbi:division plane positioning ATPase MipZ [Zavarzinia compransoris]|uniref:ATPase n=1 Tax=Zavarzinia compransoris TaxID=1264899 RepID=A0A317E9F3_9PROT|nr:division plane positioning ATPase MipZ [Zavarzinia compransoris]PWR23212.1 ATPase [Zavarzinia compransoris]TDP46228.1 chromosome partitioning protein [Zavarzinia compransoris]